MADFSKGWVKLLRTIQEHWIWQDRPFTKGQAWIDLVLSANHKNNKFMLGNEIKEVKRGEFITSQRKLSERWGWSRNTIRSFLDLLQDEKMIDVKTTHQLSHLTILNYNGIQENTTNKRATKEPLIEPPQSHSLSINNNDKNVKNEKEVTILSGKPDLETPILYLNEKTKRNYDPKNKANMALVQARFNEGRTIEDFKKVIDKKVKAWISNEDMMNFLRPKTLFSCSNFESYLNEPEITPQNEFKKKWLKPKE